MAVQKPTRILITGGNTYLGMSLAAACLAEGAAVTLLIRPDTEARLGMLAQRVRWFPADIWDAASLRGRARGHQVVIHTVGSLVADPAHGLTFHRLNFLSARNAANMCVSDGVPHFIMLSTVRAPWLNGQYVASKREAENYMVRVGLETTIIRAPLTYMRGQSRSLFYRLLTLGGSLPPLSWLGLNRLAPMPLDMLVRGIARVAMNPQRNTRILYAPELRRLNRYEERRGRQPLLITPSTTEKDVPVFPEEDPPFGWHPPSKLR